MSVITYNQTAKVLVGKTYAAEADVPDFISNAVDDDLQVLNGDGGAVAAGEPFKIFHKSSTLPGSIDFSEVIDPNKVTSVTAVAYTAPTARKIKITGFSGTIRTNCTYEVFIRLYNDGSLSTENFRMIGAFYVTGSDVSGETWNGIMQSLKDDLDASLARESNSSLFTVAINDPGAGEFSVEGGNHSFVLGKKDGRPAEFDLQAAVKANGDASTLPGTYYGDLAVEIVTAGDPGIGTGHQCANIEWSVRGGEGNRYRLVGYPSNFDTTYFVDPAQTYHVVTINYYGERPYTNVERQHRSLVCFVENADQDGGGAGTAFTAVNALIDDIEVATGLTIAALS